MLTTFEFLSLAPDWNILLAAGCACIIGDSGTTDAKLNKLSYPSNLLLLLCSFLVKNNIISPGVQDKDQEVILNFPSPPPNQSSRSTDYPSEI